MDKNILEFLGKALLNVAQNQRQWEDMNKLIGQNIAADNPFLKSFFKSIGLPNQEKVDAENIVEFTEKSSDAYKEFIKAYLTMFNVVSKEKHLIVIKENEELKGRIAELEKIIQNYKNMSKKDSYDPERIVDNLKQVISNQTQQFEELMKQLSQPYKKTTNAKKK
jgi:hypothetical protein